MSSNNQERRLDQIQRGREAVALMGLLRPYIDGRVLTLIHQMASHYRAQQADFPLLLGIAAQVTCLMDLLSDLDSTARRGDVAMKEEIKNAERAN